MFARVNGSSLYYEILGVGTPLMVMHGGMGLDHTCFRPWLDPLSDRFQHIFLDHRGNGRSERLSDFTGVDHTTWADDAEALRKHLGLGKMILFGQSAGGFVALEYARRFKDHLAGLILCDSAPALDYPDVAMANAQKRGTPEQFQQVVKTFTEPYASDEAFKRGVSIIMPVYFKHLEPSVKDMLMNNTHFCAAALNHSTLKWYSEFNSRDWLNTISTPTLVLVGREDWITPPVQGAEKLYTGIPNSKMVVFENSGHFPFIEEQDRFIKVVRDWTADL